MKIFLSFAAVLASLFGAGLMVNPEGFYTPTGMVLTPMLATIAQAHGATLIGMAVVLWLARNADPAGLKAVLTGNLVVQVLSLYVAFHTMQLGAGTKVAPAFVIHITLGVLYTYFLLRLPKKA